MSTLDELPDTEDPVHLLGIADSKIGKSMYAAQAALDGFNVVYLDGDNGSSALKHALRGNVEAQRRVHYFRITKLSDFLVPFLRSTEKTPLRWCKELNRPWNKMIIGAEADFTIWTFDVTKMPATWLLVIDSWTAVAANSVGLGDADSKELPTLLSGTDQGTYGEASSRLTYVCNILQKAPYHVYVQAHGTKYEVWDKPPGATGIIKQNQMILRETLEVPVSSSRAHGQTMASRFNHIGWFGVDQLGRTEVDFTRKPGRIGGGPPNRKELVEKLPFSKLVGSIPPHVPADGLYTRATHAEMMA